MRTPTRLIEDPRSTLRLARVQDGRIEPYALQHAPNEPWRAWRLSEVDVSRRHAVAEAPVPSQIADAVREVKASWGRYDGDKILVLLEETDHGRLSGAVMGPQGERTATYSEMGLVMEPQKD